jgi:hypothetical protein
MQDKNIEVENLQKEVNDLQNLVVFLLNNFLGDNIRSQLEETEKKSFDRILVKKWRYRNKL